MRGHTAHAQTTFPTGPSAAGKDRLSWPQPVTLTCLRCLKYGLMTLLVSPPLGAVNNMHTHTRARDPTLFDNDPI